MGASTTGRETVELAGPVENAAVISDELVAFLSGGHDDAVSGVVVEIGQGNGAGSDCAVNRNFYEPVARRFCRHSRAFTSRVRRPFTNSRATSQTEIAENAAILNSVALRIMRSASRPSRGLDSRNQSRAWVSGSIKPNFPRHSCCCTTREAVGTQCRREF